MTPETKYNFETRKEQQRIINMQPDKNEFKLHVVYHKCVELKTSNAKNKCDDPLTLDSTYITVIKTLCQINTILYCHT